MSNGRPAATGALDMGSTAKIRHRRRRRLVIDARPLGIDAALQKLDRMRRRQRAQAKRMGCQMECVTEALTVEKVETGIVKRDGWAAGPWDGEPDRIMWVSREPHHYRCQMDRVAELGTWCGYVVVPPGHIAWGLRQNRVPVTAHGGITFSARCIDDSWAFGFDACHARDLRPGDGALFGERGWSGKWGFVDYRDVGFMREEVEALAMQLWVLTAEDVATQARYCDGLDERVLAALPPPTIQHWLGRQFMPLAEAS
jgi:hypothetical protein